MKALSTATRKWLDGLASRLDLTQADDRGILRERVAEPLASALAKVG
jgi:hypothetical protein